MKEKVYKKVKGGYREVIPQKELAKRTGLSYSYIRSNPKQIARENGYEMTRVYGKRWFIKRPNKSA